VEQNLNDRFYIYDSFGVLHTIVLTQGYYNVDELITEISTKLNALNIGVFTISYSLKVFKLTITSTLAFKISSGLYDCNYTLGVTNMVASALTYEAFNCVRLNSNRFILLNFDNIPKRVNIPNIRTSASFILPLYIDGGNLNFLGPRDLEGQELIFVQDSIDLNYLEVSLWRNDSNDYYKIDSDWSVLIQVEYSDY